MEDWIQQVFAAVCGQVADRTWWPGDAPLPFCQRCTGLYVGAFVAGLFHLVRRRTPGGLGWCGSFLLLMIPLGYHWLPHGPVLRTLSGFLFGIGLVGFLLALPAWAWRERTRPGNVRPAPVSATHAGLIATALVLLSAASALILLATRGGRVSHLLLETAGTAGLALLGVLAALNVLLLLAAPWARRRQARLAAG